MPNEMSGAVRQQDDDQMRAVQRIAFLVQLGDAVRSAADASEITSTAVTMLGRYLNADRCAYVEFDDSTGGAVVVGHYVKDDALLAIVNSSREFAEAKDIGSAMRVMHPLVIDDVLAQIPRLTNLNLFATIGVRAMIVVPMIRGGKQIGGIGVFAREARVWRSDDVELVQLAAHRCWEAIERARVELELKRSEARYRSFVNTVSSIVWITDPYGAIVDPNPSWCAFTGQTWEEGRNMGWLKTLHPDDREATFKVWSHALAHKKVYETIYRIRRHDGQYRRMTVRGAPVRNDDGSIREWVGTCTDITDNNEQLVRNAYNLLEAITSGSDDLISAVDLDFKCTAANNAFRREVKAMFDADIDIGSNMVDIFDGRPNDLKQVVSLWKRAMRGETFVETVVFDDPRRGQRYYNVRLYPIRDADNNIVGAGNIIVDVTSKVEAERYKEKLLEAEQQARIEAERLSRMKDEFLATLSYELRTPLSAITGWSEMLRHKKVLPSAMEQAIEVIYRNAQVQNRLIEDLLDISQIISGKTHLDLKSVDIADVIATVIESVKPTANAKHIDIEPAVAKVSGTVIGDAERLQQVLWNLFSNAIKFTPTGGRIAVSLKEDVDCVEIGVTDNGIGIKPEFLPYVFNRFAQEDSTMSRRYGGLGLGLSIVKQLAEMHNGSVWVSSAGEGRGATFVVRLPVSNACRLDVKRPS